MRRLLIAAALWSCLGPARADGPENVPVCVSPREMHQIVATEQIVAPATAVILARRAVPGSDVLRANLCHLSGALTYVLIALRKDGRMVHVTIDARSGKVSTGN